MPSLVAKKSPDAGLILACNQYIAATAAHESILLADVAEERHDELAKLEAKQDRAAAKICGMEAKTPEGQRALAAAIHAETRDHYSIQGRGIEFFDILLRGILGDNMLAPTVRPTMTAEEQATAYGTAGRFEDANGNCLKKVSCANCANPCTEFLSHFSPHRLVTAD